MYTIIQLLKTPSLHFSIPLFLTPPCTSERAVHTLFQYMQNNLSEEIGIEDLSTRSLMSRRKLTSSFKLVTDLTIHEYHSLLRLRRAQVLLRDTVTSIGDVLFHFSSTIIAGRIDRLFGIKAKSANP